MKKALLICMMVAVFSSSSSAQAGSGKNASSGSVGTLPGTILTPQLSALYPLMDRTSALMRKATNLAVTGLNTDQWRRMAEILDDISDVVEDLARTVNRGYVIRQEKEAVERKLDDIEKRLGELERYRRP